VKSYLAVEHVGGFEPLVRELAAQDPDLLVMQDAVTVVDALSEHPEFAAQERRAGIARLREWLRGRSTYAAGQYVVSSRLPLRDCEAPALDAPGEPVRYAHCVVVATAGPLDVFTVHFVSPREGLNAARRERLHGLAAWRTNFAERLAQSRRLAEVVRASAHPVILAGDLNAEDDSPVVRQLLAAGLRDAFASAGRGYGYTHGHSLHVAGRASGVSFLRIDHVLVGPTVGVRECHAGDKEASEHRPVVAELLLVRQPGS
jgi:endonuclease/exonuclease/phosphatase family metal-dependent hydrolase